MKLDVNRTDYNVNTMKMMLDLLIADEFYGQHQLSHLDCNHEEENWTKNREKPDDRTQSGKIR